MRLTIHKPFGKGLADQEVKISICDTNPDIAQIFAEVFADEKRIEVIQGNILNLTADALVSPANSFGDMSGGLDKVIDDFYNGEAQRKAQQYIRHHYFGELPVGMAGILEMKKQPYPHLIIAPTMRIPGNVGKTINAYLAMRAILQAVLIHNFNHEEKIRHIALPSLCTGIGGMPYQEAAEQMFTAIHSILDEDWKLVVHPAMAPYALGPRWALSEKMNKFKP
ncbi:macro domain-containing protein [Cytophagaceae bacterium YF14B1]|uniref:Macro domain-containing protein n=1 Tax=Xanthocytophaga flava TaxID=3048013 RepID=A0AAE3UC10_9BACT|nr:macro domain-containing protein [Xanthocytophaga flavus]MDJ1484294.1 macro domain-containing protein [Xanthocytophaga flavus]